MNTLKYNFNEDDFEYAYSLIEAEEYIKRTHSLEEILKDYLDEIYPTESPYNKEIMKENGLYDYDSIDALSNEIKKELVDDVISDLIDDGYYDNELTKYFEDDAFDDYQDMKEYQRDPYAYNGVSRNDFF